MEFPVPKDGIDGVNGQDGKDGVDGLSIASVTIDSNNHLICTMSDGSTIDAGALPTSTGGEVNPSNLDYATEADIDKMFEGLAPIAPDKVDYATEDDINKLFENLDPINPEVVDYATETDIDKLFG